MSAINPNINFVNVELTKNKELILSCSTNDEICDVLNEIFNSYCVLFNTSELLTNVCSNIEWSIHNGFTLANKMVIITFGCDFSSKFNQLAKLKWDNFCDSLVAIIGHEFIHVYQLYKIPEKIVIHEFYGTTDIEYLSNKHEICAFAYQAVKEFMLKGFTCDDIIEVIKKPLDYKIDNSDVFWSYIYYFKSGDIVLKKFLNLMYEYCKL